MARKKMVPNADEIDQVLAGLKKPEDYSTACQMGIESWQHGDYDTAIRLYRRSIGLFPQPETVFNLSICLDDAGRTDEAVDAMKEYVRLSVVGQYLEDAIEFLEQNDKMHLIEAAAADPACKPDFSRQLGSKTSFWLQPFLGRAVDPAEVKGWMDFGDPSQVIFTYPVTPGVYALSLSAQEKYGWSGCRIFLFVATDNLVVRNVSYSVIYIRPDGAGIDMLAEATARDRHTIEAVVTALLQDSTGKPLPKSKQRGLQPHEAKEQS